MTDTGSVPSESVIAITGGTVLPSPGVRIDDGVVLVEGGRIHAVGARGEVDLPADARIIDATGSFVAPGFIEAHGHIGIWEEANGVAGDDVNEGTDAVTPGLRALDAIDIDDEGFRDALRGGVTSAVIKPGSANVIGGQTVAIKTWGGRTIDEQVILEPVSVKSALGENPKRFHGDKRMPRTRLGVAYLLRQAMADAQDYLARRDAAAAEGTPFRREIGLETLGRVLSGELIWDQHCHRHDDIVTAIRLSDEFGYRLVINHGTEGAKVADLLAERRIPVIYGPILTSRSKVELRDRGLSNLIALAQAGVRVAITTDHPVVPIDQLVLQAQLAVREGLDRRIAFDSLTAAPAEIMGIADRVGTLTAGKDGDVVIWSHDPLELAARPQRVFIGGAEVLHRDASGDVQIVERAGR